VRINNLAMFIDRKGDARTKPFTRTSKNIKKSKKVI